MKKAILRYAVVTLAAGAMIPVMAQTASASSSGAVPIAVRYEPTICDGIVVRGIRLLEAGGLPPALADVYTVHNQLLYASRVWAGTPAADEALRIIQEIYVVCF